MSCYGRKTTCSVREDKVCPPSLRKGMGKGKEWNGRKERGGEGGKEKDDLHPTLF